MLYWALSAAALQSVRVNVGGYGNATFSWRLFNLYGINVLHSFSASLYSFILHAQYANYIFPMWIFRGFIILEKF